MIQKDLETFKFDGKLTALRKVHVHFFAFGLQITCFFMNFIPNYLSLHHFATNPPAFSSPFLYLFILLSA